MATWQDELIEKVKHNTAARISINGVFYNVMSKIDEVILRDMEGNMQTYPNIESVIEHLEAKPENITVV